MQKSSSTEPRSHGTRHSEEGQQVGVNLTTIDLTVNVKKVRHLPRQWNRKVFIRWYQGNRWVRSDLKNTGFSNTFNPFSVRLEVRHGKDGKLYSKSGWYLQGSFEIMMRARTDLSVKSLGKFEVNMSNIVKSVIENTDTCSTEEIEIPESGIAATVLIDVKVVPAEESELHVPKRKITFKDPTTQDIRIIPNLLHDESSDNEMASNNCCGKYTRRVSFGPAEKRGRASRQRYKGELTQENVMIDPDEKKVDICDRPMSEETKKPNPLANKIARNVQPFSHSSRGPTVGRKPSQRSDAVRTDSAGPVSSNEEMKKNFSEFAVFANALNAEAERLQVEEDRHFEVVNKGKEAIVGIALEVLNRASNEDKENADDARMEVSKANIFYGHHDTERCLRELQGQIEELSNKLGNCQHDPGNSQNSASVLPEKKSSSRIEGISEGSHGFKCENTTGNDITTGQLIITNPPVRSHSTNSGPEGTSNGTVQKLPPGHGNTEKYIRMMMESLGKDVLDEEAIYRLNQILSKKTKPEQNSQTSRETEDIIEWFADVLSNKIFKK